MATYGYKPSGNTPPSKTSPTQGNDKARIRQLFRHQIELDELSLPSVKGSKSQNIESLASLQYPLVKINDYFVAEHEIVSMTIDCNEFLPKIVIKCAFTHNSFVSREIAKDGDIISIAIRNKSDLLKPIRNDYVITSFVSSDNNTSGGTGSVITFFGVLFIPWISSSKFNLSYEGTSYNALKDLASKFKLGFATNEDDTDDKQIWISGYSSPKQYINKTIQRSWKDDKSFFDIWIDIYYNLNFINLNKQLMGSEDSVDLGAWINNIDKEYTFGEKTSQDKVIETSKVFSNYTGFKPTSFYINKWRPINKSTNITFQVGTKMSCQMFEHNKNLYTDDESQKYWSFPIEPTYDPDKVNKYILLRGRAQQDPSTKGKDLARANYPYVEMYEKKPWMGIQYTISDSLKDISEWDGNHHPNYLRARIQNTINKKELDKLNVEVTVTGLNLNILKGDKMPVVLIQTDPIENKITNQSVETFDMLDQFYSGWYIVKGFSLKYDHVNDESVSSNFSQSFVLTRREWPPPIAVDPIEVPPNENNE